VALADRQGKCSWLCVLTCAVGPDLVGGCLSARILPIYTVAGNALDGGLSRSRPCGAPASSVAVVMPPPDYAGYRFPSDVIQRAVWMYLRFTLS
jgi:hypothetical protein